MTVTVAPGPVQALTRAAGSAGLLVRASAAWPESTQDTEPPPLPGFVVSTFSPLVAVTAERCLRRAFGDPGPRTDTVGLVLMSPLGDVTSAVHVARAVDDGDRIGPLLFFQSVPNAVAGYLAARWGLTGPVVCLSGTADGCAVAAGLVEDGDADEVLVLLAEQASGPDELDHAAAVLVGTAHPGARGALPDRAGQSTAANGGEDA